MDTFHLLHFNHLLNPPVGRQACPQICPKPTTFWGASWHSWWLQMSFVLKWGAEQIFTVKPQQSSRSWGVGGENQCKKKPPDCTCCYVTASWIPGYIQVLQRTNSSGFSDPASPGQPRLLGGGMSLLQGITRSLEGNKGS